MIGDFASDTSDSECFQFLYFGSQICSSNLIKNLDDCSLKERGCFQSNSMQGNAELIKYSYLI